MFWRPIIVIALLVATGCVAPAPPEAPPPLPAPAAKPAPKEVIILVSENIPAYRAVAGELAKRLGKRGSVRNLKKNRQENIRMLAPFRDDERYQFVSIGLQAAVAAKSLPERQVVFSQVFNYQEFSLVTGRHKGVSMVPSPAGIFGTWRALAPGIADVGVITGPGLDDMVQAAKAAAKIVGIRLHHETVHSDKEFQYAYKQLGDEVQGYWLLPDNRVLSENVLRDVMAFSVRNGKQVAVFNEDLLDLGGLFSTDSDYRDIAQRVLDRLEESQGKDVIPGPDIVYPENMVLKINPVMAQHLDLDIPSQYQKYTHAPSP